MCIARLTAEGLLSDLAGIGLIDPDFSGCLPKSPFHSIYPDTSPFRPASPDCSVAGEIFRRSSISRCFGQSGQEQTRPGTDSPEKARPGAKYELADIFRIYGPQYLKNHHVGIEQLEVMNAIENCRTGVYGFHADVCDSCGAIDIGYNSCRNGHCPKCQGKKRAAWVEARINDLLPVPYYHAVFTLPDAIFPMCLFNKKVIYDILIQSSAEALKKFGNDPKWLGGKIGFFGILHTWGQLLTVHLHIHWIIPAGGIGPDGKWVKPKYRKNNFLFPVRAVSEVYRGIFIEKLKKAYADGKLEFPGELVHLNDDYEFYKWVNRLVSKKWVVYAKKPFDGPESVIRYIGRYTHRVAIDNSRILSIDNGVIRFSYKNYKKKKSVKNYKEIWEEAELPADEFIRRFLYHVVPSGYHRIRHFGFLSNGGKKKIQDIRNQLMEKAEFDLPGANPNPMKGTPCPICRKGTLVTLMVVDGRGKIMKGSMHELIKFKTGLEKTSESYKMTNRPERFADSS